MTDRTPKPLEQYLHFKGGRYQVLCIAEKEDTGEPLVIYQALYGEGKIYARSLAEFTSEVDHVRYPSAGQKWRFLRVLPPEEEPEPQTVRTDAPKENACVPQVNDCPEKNMESVTVSEDPEEAVLLDPAIERFLDAQKVEDKLTALTGARGRMTNDMIDIMAASMGLDIEPGPVPVRYEDLKGCLLTISRYELDRTRFRSS